MKPTEGAEIELAIATDRAYLPWCATTILSCSLSNAPDEHRIHLIHADDLTSQDTDLLLRMADTRGVSIQFHPFSEAEFAVLPSKGPKLGGRLSWARILLPEMLPDLNRVIYLDADTLVVDNLADLWNLDLTGAPIAAVTNVTNPAMRPHLTSLGIASDRDYFNAGVLLADLGRWRKEGATENMMERVRSGAQFSWFDQDALNVTFLGRWKRIHPRWNAMNSLWMWSSWAAEVFGEATVGTATRSPAILHFEGPSLAKPWHFLCFHPWRNEYRSVLRFTPWASTPLEDRTVATRFIARLPREARIPTYVRLVQFRQFVGAIRNSATSRPQGA